VIVGAGGLLAVKGSAAEFPPPGAGVFTVMLTEPGDTRADAGIVAESCVEL
jgi:hypothetical protein